MSRFKTSAEEAKNLEDRLRKEGRHYDANIVKNIRVSRSAVRGVLKTLHADNMKLRQQLGLPSFLDEKKENQE